jgi:hypothetical protein
MFVNIGQCSGVKCFHCTHVFDLTNLKGEYRAKTSQPMNKLEIEITNLRFASLSVEICR